MKQQGAATADLSEQFAQGWSQALASIQGLGKGEGASWQLPQLPQITFDPEHLQSLQQQYVSQASELWQQGFAAQSLGDRRFSGEAWGSNPVASFTAAVYLLNARTLMELAEAAQGDAKVRGRLRFAVEQWMAAS